MRVLQQARLRISKQFQIGNIIIRFFFKTPIHLKFEKAKGFTRINFLILILPLEIHQRKM